MGTGITITSFVNYRETWASLAREIVSGNGGDILSVGDKISFALKDGRQAAIVAVAMNPYVENSVAFSFEDCIGECEMNDTATNRGGWQKCKMRKHMRENILPLLPDELVEVIAPRTITQIIDDVRYESTDKLWALSQTEVFGPSQYYERIDFEDVQFPYFSNARRRIKLLDTAAAFWWLRSAHDSTAYYFRGVTSNGTGTINSASHALGVSPAFIIGPRTQNISAHESERIGQDHEEAVELPF